MKILNFEFHACDEDEDFAGMDESETERTPPPEPLVDGPMNAAERIVHLLGYLHGNKDNPEDISIDFVINRLESIAQDYNDYGQIVKYKLRDGAPLTENDCKYLSDLIK